MVSAIQAAIGSDQNPGLGATTPAEREQLTALYGPEGFVPLWLDSPGRPNSDARDALGLLKNATTEGLDPVDYHAAALDSLAASLEAAPTLQIPNLAAFDAGLSANTLRYLRQLHSGRIDPRVIGFRMTTPVDAHDYAALLRTALIEHRVTEAATDLAPPLVLYRALRSMLARYRSLAADLALQNPQPTATPVRPGQAYSGLGMLYRWLLALGDSTITYRSRYMARPEWMPVLDLLIRDDSNPRSIAFQLKGLHDYLVRLGNALGDCGAGVLTPWIEVLRGLDAVRDLDPASERLAGLLEGLETASYTLSERLGLRFFSHSMLRQTYAT